MRKINKETARAFADNKNYSNSNTVVQEGKVYLYGNLIAWKTSDPLSYSFTLAGWPTVTTRSRLNDILKGIGAAKAGFHQSKGKQYFTSLSGVSSEISPEESITINF